MGKIQTYKDLIVWQRAMQLIEEVYKIVKSLPKFEMYILGSQMVRAAISIAANIAEGWGRNFFVENSTTKLITQSFCSIDRSPENVIGLYFKSQK